MKKMFYVFAITSTIIACTSYEANDKIPQEEEWTDRLASITDKDSLIEGTTYLSVYSHIFSISEHRIHDLTATISLRNTSETDKVFIKRADYFNTEGQLVRAYLKQPIYINPMETTEIMIFEKDKKGGTGGNFIFEWATENENNIPYFEGVMISTIGQQGLSFTTTGVRIK